ncbi:MAG: hypothetical protein ABMA15_27490 [Vicinamibacterales bacterium]
MAWQLRIHSLPQGKRYPDTEAEYLELLARHNAAATAVLGGGAACVLLVGLWSPDDLAVEQNRLPAMAGLKFVDVPDLPSPTDPEEVEHAFHAASIKWSPGVFDSIIRDVADEALPLIVFANLTRRAAYKPYDGGADLICGSFERARELAAEYAEWLP